ncbi:MAG: site-specific DNA-methyltransferase [Myxococcota bacterium]|nr:site-specific DNA-methyltransferase [Myxococcota bacterium]
MAGDLYCGDNLDLLRNEIAAESVDLVYLDPPFNSARTYHLVPRDGAGPERRGGRTSDPPSTGRTSEREKERAFLDVWEWDDAARRSYGELICPTFASATPSRLPSLMRALKDVLGPERIDTLAYLSMMAVRLVELRRVLRPTGSLYLHCDPTASHYLKLVMDAIFGAECFRNEIIWRYRRWPTKARRFQRMHDVLLFYTARGGNAHAFHTLYGYEKLADSTLKTFGGRKQRADFASGHRKPGVEEGDSDGPPLCDFWDVEDVKINGAPLSDAWEIGVIAPIGRERTGFPTQKPEKLLERVVRASSREGDLVLDPFCGSGTALVVAEQQRRRWVGMDASIRAIEIVKARLAREVPDQRAWTEHGAATGEAARCKRARRAPPPFAGVSLVERAAGSP